MANNLDENPQLVRIKLPFSVIQLWNDLEIGQVVKLPAKDNIDDPITILAHRDGEETIFLEFTKSADEIAGDGFATEVIILRVEQTFIDSASQTQASSPPVANHKPCDNATNKKLAKKLSIKKQAETSKPHKREEENGEVHLAMECEDSQDGIKENSQSIQVKNGGKGGTMKLPVVISPIVSEPSPEKEKKSKTAIKRRASDEGSYSSSGEDQSTPKKSRGEKKYNCNLCGAIFIYLTSYIKHMKRHGGPAATAALAAAEEKAAPESPRKFRNILPKPPEHHHHMVTRRNASLSSPSASKIDSKSSPLAVGIPPSHLILPRSISPGPSNAPVFVTTVPLIVPTLGPPLTKASSTSSVALLSPGVSPTANSSPFVVAQKPPPHVQVQNDGTHFLRSEEPLDCWVCLRQFKYPTSFLKHMRVEHELVVKVEEHSDRRRRSNVIRKPSIHIASNPETITSDSMNNNQKDEQDDFFKGHKSGQVVALQIKPNGDYVVVDSDLNEIVLGEYLLCSICLTSFQFKMEFIKHMSRSHGVLVKDMTEDGNPPPTSSKVDTQVFQCHVCNKKFFYRIPYEQHLKQIHNISMVVMDGSQTPNESYICRLCTMVFLYKTSFEKHMQREHGVNVGADGTCEPPSGNLQRSSSVENMMYRCNLCLAWFKDSTDLDDHIITQHPNYTGGRYNNTLQTESKTDSADLPQESLVVPSKDPEPDRVKDPDTKLSLIQCDHCSKTFKFRIAYSKHLRNAHHKSEDSSEGKSCAKDDFSPSYYDQRMNEENVHKIIKIKKEPIDVAPNNENEAQTTENYNGNDESCDSSNGSSSNYSHKSGGRFKSEKVNITVEMPKSSSAKGNELNTKDNELSMKDNEMSSKDNELSRKDSGLDAKDSESSTKDNEMCRKDSGLDAKEGEFNTKDNESSTKDNELCRKDNELNTKDNELSGKDSGLNTKDKELSGKEHEVSTKDTDLKSKDTELKSKDPEFKSKDTEFKSKDTEFKSKDNNVSSKDNEMSMKDNEFSAKDDELNAKDNEFNAKDSQLSTKDAGILESEVLPANSSSTDKSESKDNENNARQRKPEENIPQKTASGSETANGKSKEQENQSKEQRKESKEHNNQSSNTESKTDDVDTYSNTDSLVEQQSETGAMDEAKQLESERTEANSETASVGQNEIHSETPKISENSEIPAEKGIKEISESSKDESRSQSGEKSESGEKRERRSESGDKSESRSESGDKSESRSESEEKSESGKKRESVEKSVSGKKSQSGDKSESRRETESTIASDS